MLNGQKKNIGMFMLSLLAFSAMHVNIVFAAQSFSDVQTPIDYHSQPHETQQSDHITCSNDTQEMLNNRTDTNHDDNLVDCPTTQIFTPATSLPPIYFSLYSIQELSRKPITLTHNIILQV